MALNIWKVWTHTLSDDKWTDSVHRKGQEAKHLPKQSWSVELDQRWLRCKVTVITAEPLLALMQRLLKGAGSELGGWSLSRLNPLCWWGGGGSPFDRRPGCSGTCVFFYSLRWKTVYYGLYLNWHPHVCGAQSWRNQTAFHTPESTTGRWSGHAESGRHFGKWF